MILLENQIGCLTPELSELKKQYESVSDLFNTKKSVLQDHFSKLLNGECSASPPVFLRVLKHEQGLWTHRLIYASLRGGCRLCLKKRID